MSWRPFRIGRRRWGKHSAGFPNQLALHSTGLPSWSTLLTTMTFNQSTLWSTFQSTAWFLSCTWRRPLAMNKHKLGICSFVDWLDSASSVHSARLQTRCHSQVRPHSYSFYCHCRCAHPGIQDLSIQTGMWVSLSLVNFFPSSLKKVLQHLAVSTSAQARLMSYIYWIAQG